MVNLLVVDFDFFFPNRSFDVQQWQLWDWAHNEKYPHEFQNLILWPTRAASFISHGMDLPGLSGEEETFWDRFRFRKHVDLFYADSNMFAIEPQVYRNIDSVWLFDAHHDAGYHRDANHIVASQRVDCGEWMVMYDALGADLHVRYPQWVRLDHESDDEFLDTQHPKVELDQRIDDPAEEFPRFDRIFLCRSGSWVPPWVEDAFWDLLDRAPVQRRVNLDTRPSEIERRDWNAPETQEAVQTWVEQTARLREQERERRESANA